MGLGYEWKAGNGLNLRVNPYLQIPLKTIGMGSMPVVSTGIYLGLYFHLLNDRLNSYKPLKKRLRVLVLD